MQPLNSSHAWLVAHAHICDTLSENPALCANTEFELEAILSIQVISQLSLEYYTNVSQEARTVSY